MAAFALEWDDEAIFKNQPCGHLRPPAKVSRGFRGVVTARDRTRLLLLQDTKVGAYNLGLFVVDRNREKSRT